ncbi:hypothetical protein VPHD148_0175 [Vibrio phage D148]
MKNLILLLTTLTLLPVSVQASEEHPVRQILTLSEELDMDRIDTCTQVIEIAPEAVVSEPECDYLAQEGARVLTIMVETLVAEGQDVNKENRHNIPGIAWDNLSIFEMGSMVMTAFELSDAAVYMGKNHPDMVSQYMSTEVLEQLTIGGVL